MLTRREMREERMRRWAIRYEVTGIGASDCDLAISLANFPFVCYFAMTFFAMNV
jgi:hypothetical protein